MTATNVDEIFDRFDQSTPEIQKGMILEFIIKALAYDDLQNSIFRSLTQVEKERKHKSQFFRKA